MALQHRILFQEGLGFAFRAADERLVAAHREEAQVSGRARLAGSKHVAFLAQTQVSLGELETVGSIREGLQARSARVCEFVSMHSDAQRGQGGPSDASAQLMELGETELLGVEDDHEGRLRHVDADLDDGCGDE